jgi:alpha-tubulin suppressor-like RCC1 family protein
MMSRPSRYPRPPAVIECGLLIDGQPGESWVITVSARGRHVAMISFLLAAALSLASCSSVGQPNHPGSAGQGAHLSTGASGSATGQAKPTSPGGGPSKATLSAGVAVSCVIRSGGHVFCWGSNISGRLGLGLAEGPQTCSNNEGDTGGCAAGPVQVIGVADAVQVASGQPGSCALVKSGQIYCWGYNGGGQLGDGSTSGPRTCDGQACSPSPVRVRGLDNATNVAMGLESACALVRGGQIYCWGANAQGDLGLGTSDGPQLCAGGSACSASPVPIVGLNDATQVSVGDGYACALHRGGTVSCWGANASGTVGTGLVSGPDPCGITPVAFSCALRPVPVLSIRGVVAISAGSTAACALLANGHVRCWGANMAGGLGLGTSIGPRSCQVQGGVHFACSPTPTEVLNLDNAVAISVGGGYGCAVTTNKRVKCWGANYAGTLGIGTSSGPQTCTTGTTRSACATLPQAVPNLSDVDAVAAGFSHVCASLGSGEIQCWGANSFGELGSGITGGEQCHINAYISSTDACSTLPVKVVVYPSDGATASSPGE